MKLYKKLITLVTTSLLVLSCGSDHKTSIAENMTPIVVKINAVQTDQNNLLITASGKIQASNSANLSTRMMGFVNKIYVNVGDKVNKGQLLLSVNNTELQAKRAQVNAGITEATAAFTIAEKDYNRYKNLFAENSVSQKELDDMTAHFEMAKARLEGANQMKNEIDAQFTYANIRAPFNGVVTNKFIEAGDMANPGMTLIAIESPKQFEVTAMVAESDISKIRSNSKVDVLVKSMNQSISGIVSEISSSAKNTGGQYLVKIALDKTDAKILSGMFTTVQFPVEKTEKTSSMIMIPTSSIVANGSLKGIYTVSEQNTAILRWLRIGKTYGDKVEILSGLNATEHYIVHAEGKLFNGAKVTIQ
ncbi:MAG: efflux RND transporter periplasmic adaptor subunit [Aureibaculum sp.]|nr:efflux RND transporter periplasmic adaptor subunit [Aureibaculum sp.]